VEKAQSGGWDCNVASGVLDRKLKVINAKVKVVTFGSTDESGLMLGIHKSNSFNTDSAIYSDQGCYISYGGSKYGQLGSNLDVPRTNTDFILTVDFESNQFTIEHNGSKHNTSISSFSNDDIVFSFCLYYNCKLEIEFY